VILVDVDPAQADKPHADMVLFSGMTRATVRLELLVNSKNPSNVRFSRPRSRCSVASQVVYFVVHQERPG